MDEMPGFGDFPYTHPLARREAPPWAIQRPFTVRNLIRIFTGRRPLSRWEEMLENRAGRTY